MTPAKAKIRAIAPWFGGKRSMADLIVGEAGDHNSWFEPFCGGVSILFAKPHSSMETLNDKHGDLVTTAMVLASPRWCELYEQVDRMCLSQHLIDVCVAEMDAAIVPPATRDDVCDHHIARASAFLAAAWIGRNGVMGTKRTNYKMALRWTQGGGSPGIRWRSAVESVPGWHDRLKGVVIANLDGFQVIDSVEDEPGTVLYVDPPYFHDTLSGTSRYEFDFDESDDALFGGRDDHSRLARRTTRRCGGCLGSTHISTWAR